MQLMCDAVSVLGSRHGILWDPRSKECRLIRFDAFTECPRFQLRAGIIIGGEEIILPLASDGATFTFLDQRTSPCTMSIMGIDPGSATKLKLTAVTPFRPRDGAFSTTPVINLRLTAVKLPGTFRWDDITNEATEAELFLEITSEDFTIDESRFDALDVTFMQHIDASPAPFPQRDRLVVTQGTRVGKRFTRTITLYTGEPLEALEIAWCTHSAPVLQIHGTCRPFKYIEQFADLDAVADWARAHPSALFENAVQVDGIIAQNNLSPSVNHLLAYSLHTWLGDTWWVKRDDTDWFSVWEGSCYFHSTVDVEYTQSPFYLAVWPELLRSELDFWPEFSKDGTHTLGDRGMGTLFLSHDAGVRTSANGQAYPHEMEVEETSNYLILAYAYYKRSGDDSMIRKHGDIITKYLAFLAACDSTGNGVPDLGIANTIDDASPAVQFGREQVYLAVKTLAAYAVGACMLDLLGLAALAANYRLLAARLRAVIEEKGWQGDHYATLLEKRGELTNPWSGEVSMCEEIPGWNAAHIYTANGIVPLDMIGFDLGLSPEHLATDLRVASERCLREYGCIHSDYSNSQLKKISGMEGLAGVSSDPGWVSMNMLRDMAAFYRGIDLQALSERYWEWQILTNTQETKLFFETFNGNNLCFYPRGIAIWGYFDALSGLVIDQTTGTMTASCPFPQVKVPRLFDADWRKQGE